MLKSGEWLAISIFGLSLLFVFIAISFFLFLIGPDGSGPRTTVDPSTSFLQVIFISLAPAFALSFFSNSLSGDSRISYILVIFSGLTLILGMIYVSTLVPQVDDIELPYWVAQSPWIFSIFGTVMILVGLRIHRRKTKKVSDNYDI